MMNNSNNNQNNSILDQITVVVGSPGGLSGASHDDDDNCPTSEQNRTEQEGGISGSSAQAGQDPAVNVDIQSQGEGGTPVHTIDTITESGAQSEVVDLNSIAEATLNSEGQIILTGEDGHENSTTPKDQMAEFQEVFKLFDDRGDGKIHVAQIGNALRALGQNPTDSDVKKYTHQHKPDERVSFEVFLSIYQQISKLYSADTGDDLLEALRNFDKDGKGYISAAELRHVLTTLEEKMTDDEVEQLLQGQEDSHGNINYEEFARMIMSD